MMRSTIVLALLVPFCLAKRHRIAEHTNRGSQSFPTEHAPHTNRGNKVAREQALLTMEIEEAYAAAAPLPAEEGVSSLGQLFILVCMCAVTARALTLIEDRRKLSVDVWLASQKNLNLCRALACISVCQSGFAVLRIFDSTAFLSGLIDLANASVGCYFSVVSFTTSTLPTYLLLNMFTSVIDVLMLLWDLEHWEGSWGDVMRPCLCFASIYLAYTLLNEVRQYSGTSKGLADRILDTVVASSLVQQAVMVIGMVEIDPLLSGENTSPKVGDTIDLSHLCEDHAPDVLPSSPQATQEETHQNAGVLSAGLDSEVNDLLSRYSSMLDSEPRQLEEPVDQGPDLDTLPVSQPLDLQQPADDVPEFASDELVDDLL